MTQKLNRIRKVTRCGLAKAERAHMEFVNVEVFDPGWDRQPRSEFVDPEIPRRN